MFSPKNSSEFLTPAAVLMGSLIIAGAILSPKHETNKEFTAISQAPTLEQPRITLDSNTVSTKSDPYIGRIDAPVTIAYWYDYQCPFCRQNEELTIPSIIKDYIDTGKVKLVFKDLQFLGPDSQTLGAVSSAVWELAPDKFYAWHKAIFDNQGRENSGWVTKEKLLSISIPVLGASVADKVMALAVSNASKYQQEMDADKAEASSLGIISTPSLVIGTKLVVGALPYEDMRADIETALRGR
jgi:protein-disulfide isomerase